MAHFWDDDSKVDGLRNTAEAFCKSFIAGSSPSETLDKYFTPNAKILEHGPTWARDLLPFLATIFQGRRSHDPASTSPKNTCDDYYDLLTSTLYFRPNDNTLPPKEEFMVDARRGIVTIKLHAKFASIKTGRSWEEDFIYVLSEFDKDYKIGSQELWADPLSAYFACREDNKMP